jgi:hypothetical protein
MTKMRVHGHRLEVAITAFVLLVLAAHAFGQNCPVQFPGQQLVPTVTLQPESSGTYPANTNWAGFVSQTSDPCAPWSGQSVHFLGWRVGGSSEELPGTDSHLVYRYELDYGQQVTISSVVVQGAAFQGDDCCPQLHGPAEIRLLDANKNVLFTQQTNSGNSFQTYTLSTPGAIGQVFYLDEFTTSVVWRYRSSIVVNTDCPLNQNDVHPFAGGQYSVDGKPTSMFATFVPTDSGLPVGLAFKATACGYTDFDWQQTVKVDPDANLVFSTQNPTTPLAVPYPDPPPYGYTYQAQDPRLSYTPNAAYPFYFDQTAPQSYPLSLLANETPLGDPPSLRDSLLFVDSPFDNSLPAGTDVEFETSLVGIVGLSPGAVASPPLYTWTWKSNFNGTSGGASIIHAPNNPFPADPGSGTGGITITSINGVPQTPPSVSCTATPSTLWPPNGKSVPVTVSGSITPGTSSLVSGGAAYLVIDEYGQDQPSGQINLNSDGSYSFQVGLIAARNGNDQDGRTYTIIVNGQDTLGNTGSCSAIVTVPHDKG